MPISIHTPVALNEKGKRQNNEDSIAPALGQADRHDRLFMVCDGVGGAEKGEVASHLVCESFREYLKDFIDELPQKDRVEEALRFAEGNMTSFMEQHPDAAGMGTTLTLLWLHETHSLAAWCGDSRIYHFRNGKILWRSDDHSLVGQMVRFGDITEEQAKSHPQRNIILRAVSGNHKPTDVECHLLTDLQNGDLLLLCTDGVTEGLSDAALEMLVQQSESNAAEVRDMLYHFCQQHSNDNFSLYLIPIEHTDKDLSSLPLEEEEIGVATHLEPSASPSLLLTQEEKTKTNYLPYLLGGTAALLSLLVFFLWRNAKEKTHFKALAERAQSFEMAGVLDSAAHYYNLALELKDNDTTLQNKIRYLSDMRLQANIVQDSTAYLQDKIAFLESALQKIDGDTIQTDSTTTLRRKTLAQLDIYNALLLALPKDSAHRAEVPELLLYKDTLSIAKEIFTPQAWKLLARYYREKAAAAADSSAAQELLERAAFCEAQ